MQITQDIFKWLKSLNVVQSGTPQQNGRIELDPGTTGAFYNGFKMSELLDKLLGQYNQQVKMQTNPTIRLYNWNIVIERLHSIQVDVDEDIKKLIISGDIGMIAEILKDVHSKFGKENKQQMEYPKKELDIETLNSAKPISSCGSIYEYIIVALSQNLVLKPRQSQQLLNNNFKLLTHVFIKGVKGFYNQIISLLQEIYNNIQRLIELCREEEHQIGFVIQFLKLSLFSKDSDVVHWGLRLLSKLAFELAQHDLLFHIFQWLTSSGLQNLIITSQRQPQLAEPIAVALTQIACYDFSQVFGQQKFFETPKAYIEFYGLLLPYINCDLLNFNLEQQIQIAIRLSDNQNTRDERAIALLFLCNSWIYYHTFLEQNMQYQQSILGLIQRSSKDNSMILKQYSITQAFRLLDGLAQKKVVTAVSVYKKLISILVESQNSEYILRQFAFIIQKYPSIPIELLIEGLIKNYSMNIAECDIYYIISAHQNLKIYSAIQILELLLRIYNSNIVFQSALLPAIQQLIQKFIEISEFQEYLTRMTQTCLTLYVNSVKQKKTTGNASSINYQDDSVVNQQRRASIIQLLKYIITLRCYSMNNQLKPLLVGAHLELRNIENRENKGIVHLLSLLGDPNTIVEEVVQFDQQLSSQLFLEKKMQQMEGSQSQALEDQYIKQNKKLFEKEEDLVKSLLLEEKAEANSKKEVKKKKRNYDFEDFQCVFDEGDLAYKQQELMLVDFSQEEDVDRESINIAIKYYSKTFRYLFQKYATSPQEAAKNRLRNLDQSQLQLRASDVVKILQDYEIYNFSTYEEIINLVQTINNKFNLFNPSSYYQPQHVKDTQTDQQSSISATTARTINYLLDYENFKRFLVQYAIIIFGRPPKDLRKMPVGHVLVEFFKFFSFVARRRNENHLIYDDPEGVTTVADKQTIQKWNAQLLQNPQTEVPSESRLKKVQTEKVALSYKMRSVIPNLSASYLISFEIINEIIQSKFKTNIVEPIFKVNLIYEVKPIAAKGVHQELKIDPLIEKQEYLKNSLSLLPLEKQELLNKSLDLSQLSEEKVINKSIVGKIINQQEEVLMKELKDIKWKKHKEYLDKQFEKIQQFRVEKEQQRLQEQAQVAEQKVTENLTFKPKHSDYMQSLRKQFRIKQSEVIAMSKSQPELAKKFQSYDKKAPEQNKLQPIPKPKKEQRVSQDKKLPKNENPQQQKSKQKTAQVAQEKKK